MVLQRLRDRVPQHGDAVLAPFTLPDHDFPSFEIAILDPQPRALHEPYPGAIRKSRHECVCAIELGQQPVYFGAREHNRKALRPLRALHAV